MNIIEFLARELSENIVCRIDVGTNEAITITDKNEVSLIEGLNLIKINETTHEASGQITTTKEYIPLAAIKKLTFIERVSRPNEIHIK